jgi:hypothetical protein
MQSFAREHITPTTTMGTYGDEFPMNSCRLPRIRFPGT